MYYWAWQQLNTWTSCSPKGRWVTSQSENMVLAYEHQIANENAFDIRWKKNPESTINTHWQCRICPVHVVICAYSGQWGNRSLRGNGLQVWSISVPSSTSGCSFLLTCALWGTRRWLSYTGACHPPAARSRGLSSQLLTWGCPRPDYCGHLGVEPVDETSVCLSFSALKNKEQKKDKTKESWNLFVLFCKSGRFQIPDDLFVCSLDKVQA